MLRKTLVMCFVIFLSGLTACTDDGAGPLNSVSFEIDGELWESTTASATLISSGSVFSLNIIAQNEAGERVEINVFDTNSSGTGVFFINKGQQNNVIYSPDGQFTANSQDGVACPSTDGSINVTFISEFDVSGTFESVICGQNGQSTIRTGRFERVVF